ncbi:chromate transporter-domain-containing protein [Daldinia caldariorum]|uniref:chromate transporter-domain-containing protein n=1 Tax=Daldinia caldariorum TaxID=326644 RepID=UPI002008224D|nr:chromate transporter-domain-containing protein [Daldinia caldariorum]KAI1470853.1 chromate transporter-domain-containing protein [Daldinia caldariorum]
MISNSWEEAGWTVARRAWKTLKVNWHLGFTSFGGPPVHFRIFHDKFVSKLTWIDEQVYQELFSICQALSGPASTKMLYCVNLLQDGLLGGVLAFFIWSLPGALGMFGLSIGVSNIGEALPRAVYALLSGLNAATVGIIALAAVELSNKAITDKLTRIIVFLTAVAGMLYNALWYFPVLMLASACTAVIYDYRWPHRFWLVIKDILLNIRGNANHGESNLREAESPGVSLDNQDGNRIQDDEPRIIPPGYFLEFSWKSGSAIISAFFVTFIGVMVLRGALSDLPVLYRLFANLYLAGTIIFGGGPVVIPLLREYVVAEGWVSPRDFLIGLAIAQAFPGPNFNFAVFLGGLTAINQGYPSIAGAVIAFCGIFLPGIALVHGTMGIWRVLRSKRWVKSGVRGINAGAVGLIYTAVYRIWQVGYIDEGFQSGKSLGDDPWWVVVTATAYVGGRYFGVAPPAAILLGAVLGLIRYGVVSGHAQVVS